MSTARRWAIGLLVFALALALRLLILPVSAGFPFLTFYPALALAALFLGTGPTLLILVLGGGVGYFIFIEPHGAFKAGYALVALVAYLVAGIAITLLAQKRHRDSESRIALLASIVQWSNDAIASKTPDGIITSWNPEAERQFGYSEAEAIGKPISIIFPPDRQAEERAILDRIRRGETVKHYETVRRRKDGTTFETSVTVSPIRDHHSAIIGASKVSRDISESKRIERERQVGRAQLDAALNSMSEAVVIADASGRLIEFNDAFVTFHRFRDRTDCARGVEEYAKLFEVYASDGTLVPGELRLIRRALRGESAAYAEYTLRRRDTGETWIGSYNYAPIRDPAGQIVGSVVTARDITEQKKNEEQLRIAATAFDSQESIVITNSNGIILRVNRAFTESTGYDSEEVIGRPMEFLWSDRHDSALFRTANLDFTAETVCAGESWVRRKDNNVFPVWLAITAVKSSAGERTHYVATMVDMTERKAAENEIETLAFFDPLTGLPNRRLLFDQLKRAIASSSRSGRAGALMFIDLDNFKMLNDTLGHDKGDLLLREVGNRLRTCVREGDTVARLGGDEFVVMLEDLSEKIEDAATQTEKVGEKVLSVLRHPYQLADHPHETTASIGMVLFREQPVSVEEVVKQADIAMYQAKAAGRNMMRFFDPSMQAAFSARLVMEADLRLAIANHQLLLYYQLQVDGRGGLTGVEALVRWRHPQRGLVSPAEFIPLAEETGLILPLGAWVLETACTQIAAWSDRPLTDHFTIAVNVSARQFRQKDFVEQVLAIVRKSRADPTRLKLELTESMLLDNVEDIIGKMTALKDHGISFSLDDFGTGYSSLSYLKRLPLSQLKIDQSFVRDVLTDVNDATIARTIIALGQSLGLKVIAEGVETEGQQSFLAESGCNAYQGYLFGRPLPIDELEARLGPA